MTSTGSARMRHSHNDHSEGRMVENARSGDELGNEASIYRSATRSHDSSQGLLATYWWLGRVQWPRDGFADLRGFRRVWQFRSQDMGEKWKFERRAMIRIRPGFCQPHRQNHKYRDPPRCNRVTSGFQCGVTVFEEYRSDRLQNTSKEGRKGQMGEDDK